MAKILRAERDCTGAGLEVWTDASFEPLFFMGAKVVDMMAVDAALAVRAATQADADKQAEIDDALEAELERRKPADIYVKTPADAVASVFSVAAGEMG